MAKKKGKAEQKNKGKKESKDTTKLRAKDKPRVGAKGTGKGKAKIKGKDKNKPKRKIKVTGKAKGEGKTKAGGKDRVKDKAKAEVADKEVGAEAPRIASIFVQRRWKQVAGNLGLENHVAAVSRWNAYDAPPILTGFTFVRHIESAARDLKCAGTSVTMTPGVVVRREDGKLFLTGRGVTAKFLGIQVPRKNPADAGKRFLTAQEREELGQPEAQGTVTKATK